MQLCPAQRLRRIARGHSPIAWRASRWPSASGRDEWISWAIVSLHGGGIQSETDVSLRLANESLPLSNRLHFKAKCQLDGRPGSSTTAAARFGSPDCRATASDN